MDELIETYKGTSPGTVLDQQLKQRKLKQAAFAHTIDLPAQTLNAIIKGKRKMTPETALKIDQGLGLEESTMAILQAIYDTRLIKLKITRSSHPDFSKLRRILFWDTDFDRIDWQQQKGAVIRRVFERGNEQEQAEVRRFYGNDQVNLALTDQRPPRPLPSFLRQKAG